mgnify:CR=1 FL=1
MHIAILAAALAALLVGQASAQGYGVPAGPKLGEANTVRAPALGSSVFRARIQSLALVPHQLCTMAGVFMRY